MQCPSTVQPLTWSFAAAAAPAFGPTIRSANSGNMFTISTAALTQPAARQACNDMGAHLAAFSSLEEQAEMESRFAALGYLLPAFHKAYWLGLMADVLWQPDRYKWLDKSVPGGLRSMLNSDLGCRTGGSKRDMLLLHCLCLQHVSVDASCAAHTAWSLLDSCDHSCDQLCTSHRIPPEACQSVQQRVLWCFSTKQVDYSSVYCSACRSSGRLRALGQPHRRQHDPA